jgi:hypothetical protein
MRVNSEVSDGNCLQKKALGKRFLEVEDGLEDWVELASELVIYW